MAKVVDHEERRRAIAAAAIESIAKLGLANTRLVDIAGAAGCTTGAISHYFAQFGPTRSGVLMAAAEAIMADTRDLIGSRPGAHIREILHLKLPLDDGSLRRWRVWTVFTGEAATDPAAADRFERYYAELVDAFVARCDQYMREGIALPPIPPMRLADLCISTLDGLALRVVLEGLGAWPPERQHRILDDLLDALRLPGTSASPGSNAADESV